MIYPLQILHWNCFLFIDKTISNHIIMEMMRNNLFFKRQENTRTSNYHNGNKSIILYWIKYYSGIRVWTVLSNATTENIISLSIIVKVLVRAIWLIHFLLLNFSRLDECWTFSRLNKYSYDPRMHPPLTPHLFGVTRKKGKDKDIAKSIGESTFHNYQSISYREYSDDHK